MTETGKNKRHYVRFISLALVAILLVILMLFHQQLSNYFTPTQPPPKVKLQPAATIQPAKTVNTNITPTKSAVKPALKLKPNTDSVLLSKQGFTIQLMGVYNFGQLTKFAATNNLTGKSYIFHSINKGQDWYTLIYGIYPTRAQAEATLAQLSPTLKQLKPWIRSMDSVHNVILQNK